MQKAKVDVLVAQFCYSGKGGTRTVYHELMGWWARVFAKMSQDERIGRIALQYPGDVPLTMVRNNVVQQAKSGGFDFIWMIDNDNIPDLYVGKDEEAKPFWQSSFDFAFERLVRGLPSVVVAPYRGPPPHPTRGGMENVYVFYWEVLEGEEPHAVFKTEAYSPQHASMMRGIQPIACGPTGCALYSTSAFDLMPIRQLTKGEILDQYAAGQLSQERALRLLNMESWFFYEYTDQTQSAKASTEDCTNTREISLAGHAKFRQDVVFCNWDAWAGHAKPKVVGKPRFIHTEQISEQYLEAVANPISITDRIVNLKLDEPVETVAPIKARSVNGQAVRTGRSQADLDVLESVASLVPQARFARIADLTCDPACAVVLTRAGTVFSVGQSSPGFVDIADNTKIKLIIGDPASVGMSLDRQELDVILCEDPKLIDIWLQHLAPDGFLCGFKVDEPEMKQRLAMFLDAGCDVRTFENSSAWIVSNAELTQALATGNGQAVT